MDPCNSDANQKTFFTDLKIKFLHQLVVYPAQLGNLFFMLPLSDISVFPLMFGLVANLPMSIFVLSRKNAFTNATDYVIFVLFCFVFFSFVFWFSSPSAKCWTSISASDTNFQCFSSHCQRKFRQTTVHWKWRKLSL